MYSVKGGNCVTYITRCEFVCYPSWSARGHLHVGRPPLFVQDRERPAISSLLVLLSSHLITVIGPNSNYYGPYATKKEYIDALDEVKEWALGERREELVATTAEIYYVKVNSLRKVVSRASSDPAIIL